MQILVAPPCRRASLLHAGLLKCLRFERVDNLRTYIIPSLLIPSDFATIPPAGKLRSTGCRVSRSDAIAFYEHYHGILPRFIEEILPDCAFSPQ